MASLSVGSMPLRFAKVERVIIPRLGNRSPLPRPNRLWALAFTLSLLPLVAWPAPANSPPMQPPSVGTPVVANQPAIPPPQTNAAPQSVATVEFRLSSIDAAIQKLTVKADKTDYTPVWIGAGSGLLGVIVGGAIGGIVNFLMQRRLLTHQKALADEAANRAEALADAKATQERELASRRAELEIGNSFVQWQLKQLSELYGPLHALLDQSRGLYRHMNEVLVKSDPQQFRFESPAEHNATARPIMQVHYLGCWVRFRTLLHIELVYGRGYGTDDYFSEIVETGSRMVNIIQEKAGYIRPDQTDLSDVFGRYLAHHSVLKRLHDYVKAEHERFTSGVDQGLTSQTFKPPIAAIEAAVFPREIDEMVAAGFLAITRELSSWRARGGNAAGALPAQASPSAS